MCAHLDAMARRRVPVRPGTAGCEECLATGGTWIHLRLCMACGHVGCCDSSPGRHATRHHHASGHPVIKAFEPGEDWAFCYLHDEVVRSIQAWPDESPRVHFTSPHGPSAPAG